MVCDFLAKTVGGTNDMSTYTVFVLRCLLVGTNCFNSLFHHRSQLNALNLVHMQGVCGHKKCL